MYRKSLELPYKHKKGGCLSLRRNQMTIKFCLTMSICM
uniref:Uncharacterized protein n=1 Tax=Anguilla anguilla TaxID=7936 RepID=A0A0E9V6D0_ANGAN